MVSKPALAPSRYLDEGLPLKDGLDVDEGRPRRRWAPTLARFFLLAALAFGAWIWIVYEDAAVARPWYNIKEWGIHFQGEGASAFRV
jgi:hypothetical protein